MIDQAEKPAAKDKDGKRAASLEVSTRLIEGVSVELEAILGAAEMTVAEVARLAAGDVLALDAQLNAAVELRLNGVAVARGELVAVGEKFGVRISEIVQWPD